MTTPAAAAKPENATSVKETLTSIIIAFAMAFVFRGFVIEAFVIPTGSMAPTLLGAHMDFKSPYSGYEWTVGPKPEAGGLANPAPIQLKVDVRDPMTGMSIARAQVPTSWGDRIFVMKYLYSLYEPKRFDVVVFKNPTEPSVNYIKRLVGLPNEMVALVDGDVFVRPLLENESAESIDRDRAWTGSAWHVARKPEAAQRAMWQPVFDSQYTPIDNSSLQFRSPWIAADGTSGKWSIADRRAYEYSGSGPTALSWDASRPITDAVAYNELSRAFNTQFPVSDLRMSLGVRPQQAGVMVSAIVRARRHEFRADVEGSSVTLRMRQSDGENPDGSWATLGQGTLPRPLTPGEVTNIDFWHVDQSLQVFIDDHLVAHGAYEWTPEERVRWATDLTLESINRLRSGLIDPKNYLTSSARFEFSGGPFTLYRVAMARDIHYQAAQYHKTGQPARATAPSSTAVLTGDQFFTCGDNSPMSLDARLWDSVDPWVAEVDSQIGVVHRDLLIGKAFLVYFPAPKRSPLRVPIPDFGSMRFIW